MDVLSLFIRKNTILIAVVCLGIPILFFLNQKKKKGKEGKKGNNLYDELNEIYAENDHVADRVSSTDSDSLLLQRVMLVVVNLT